jgi:hypothetical protein
MINDDIIKKNDEENNIIIEDLPEIMILKDDEKFKDNDGNLQYAGEGEYGYDTQPFRDLYNPKEDIGFYNLLNTTF